MRPGIIVLVLVLMVTALVAEGDFLWQEGGLPIVISQDVRWNGSSVETPDCGTIIIWTELLSDNYNLYGMRLDAESQMIWDEPRLLVDDALPVFDEKITLAPDGSIYISWFELSAGTMKVNRFDLEGNPQWTSPFSQDCYTGYYYDDKYNCGMIPVIEGGVYVFWKSDSSSYAMRLSATGAQIWDEPLALFDEISEYTWIKCVVSDGQDGFLVASDISQEDEDVVVIQHVLDYGVIDWSLSLPETEILKLIQSGDNEFAAFSVENGDQDQFCLYRFNLGGELIDDEPLTMGCCDYAHSIDISIDTEGNLYPGWSYYVDQTGSMSVAKVTPDNQILWQNDMDNDSNYNYDNMHVDVDAAGNVYQAWQDNTINGIRVLKLNPDGGLHWNKLLASDVNTYSGYVNMVMDAREEGVCFLWCDASNEHESIFRQIYSEGALPQFDEESSVIHQGWTNDIYNLSYAVRDEPQDELFFSWWNYTNKSMYVQSLNMDGELGLEPPGIQMAIGMLYGNECLAILPYGDLYYIVWESRVNHSHGLYCNLIDAQGNRQWAEDLLILSPFVFDLTVSLYQDQLLIYWQQFGYAWRMEMVAQRVINGELAWEEPVVIDENVSYICCAKDDYVVWTDSRNRLNALRLDESGEPCEGWGDEGVNPGEDHSAFTCFLEKMDDGIAIVWRESSNGTLLVRMQILHEDGTLEFDECPVLAQSSYLSIEDVAINNSTVFATIVSNGAMSMVACDLAGNTLWDEPVVIDPAMYNSGNMASTPDGILVTYSKYVEEDYHYDLYLQHVDFDGNMWSEPKMVCGHRGYRYEGKIVAAPDNKYFITWLDTRDMLEKYFLYSQLYQYEPVAIDDRTAIPAWDPNLTTYPNPFNPETTVQFSLQKDTKVALKVYNVKGQLVRTLCDEVLPLGEHQIEWDGRDNIDKNVSSGVYLINLNVNGRVYRSKALLLK